ncbi:hypothetical protein [Egicoccus halophilus]|uniref:1,4-alpha-glucan branching enzyme n=1 Tax=Egicoccus halophilus TaxID=1670830 RepID=A0A8J3A8E4_9ACTN|nr:hypothetical protein [Egicoccus halophilus]GGI04549.1 hypothetical protein GCM10011354_09650 [Egicoccus halophilus]
MSESTTTTDHDEIRSWAEARDAVPATPRGTEEADGGPGVLTLDVQGHGADESELEHVDWDVWFDKFEAEKLAFLYQEQKADGETSTFFKLVSRD